MDSKPDDHDPDQSPVGSTEDLEEALKWLEDLTARQSKSTDLSNPVPAASLDSPFRGLIDDDAGDLPDWLREAPVPPADDSYTEGDAESRLDWLAKMAQRESIEELPTLEWRRLSEPVQSAIIARGHEPQVEAPDVTPPDETALPTPEQEEEWAAELTVESVTADQEPEPFAAEAVVVDQWPEASAPPAEDVSAAEWLLAEPSPITPNVLSVAEEELRLEIEAGAKLPPLDDLDAAMAWIEELAASQDAPIEDIPSVADRALASKLMIEAGLSPEGSILDELGSDSGLVEGLTPTHPFIEEEDFADTVVLVETIVADQGMIFDTPEPNPESEGEVVPVAPSLPATPGLDDFLPPADTVGEPEALSFEDAMAILDEIAVAQQTETGSATEPLAESLPADEDDDFAKTARELAETMAVEASAVAIIESTDDESVLLLAKEAPWNEPLDETVATFESPLAYEAADHSAAPPALAQWDEAPPQFEVEGADTELPAPELEDELAEGETPSITVEGEGDGLTAAGQNNGALEAALAALDALALPTGRTLDDLDARLQTAQLTPWRDVTSALDWLESALATRPSPAPVADVAPVGEGEAGWFDRMPEDPDAVLAWLEQMAAVEEREVAPLAPVDSVTADVTEGGSVATAAPELGEADLLAMPEDPDEAMLWLESLAHGNLPAAQPPTPETVQPVVQEVEMPDEGAPATTPPVEDEMIAVAKAEPEPSWPVEEDVTASMDGAAEAMQPVADEAAPLTAAEELAPLDEATPAAEQAAPTPKKPRGRPRKLATPPAQGDAAPSVAESAEPPAEPSPSLPVGAEEPPNEPPPAKPKTSWVDLLKPLD